MGFNNNVLLQNFLIKDSFKVKTFADNDGGGGIQSINIINML
jgi:hypothetical protein